MFRVSLHKLSVGCCALVRKFDPTTGAKKPTSGIATSYDLFKTPKTPPIPLAHSLANKKKWQHTILTTPPLRNSLSSSPSSAPPFANSQTSPNLGFSLKISSPSLPPLHSMRHSSVRLSSTYKRLILQRLPLLSPASMSLSVWKHVDSSSVLH